MLRFDLDTLTATVKKSHELNFTIHPADIDCMARLGVMAVTNPYRFVKEDSAYPQTVSFVGEERAAKHYPMKSFFNKGVVVTQVGDVRQ